jgi:GNAT superfamily N-acetyltransferase
VGALARMKWAMEIERYPDLTADCDTFFADARASIQAEIERGLQVGFLAEAGGEAIACAILIWWPMLPTLTERQRRRGFVSTVYTLPAYRRRGVARQIMENLMARARELGIHRVILWASEMGRPLYFDLGFAPSSALEWRPE